MRRLRPLLTAAAVVLLIAGSASRAFAVSIRDLVALANEGVSDTVLVALIETDGSRFSLGVEDIRSLRAQGVSDQVITAMLRTARPTRDNPRPVAEIPALPQEALVVPSAPAPAPAPVIVKQSVVQHVDAPARYSEPVYVPYPVYVAPVRPVEVKKEEPVYWGWGGQRRPDAWKEPEPAKKPEKPPVIKK